MAYKPGDNVRIGDAERHEMSETLAKHFADGRLDESEFRERMDEAMAAKTRADLSGLLHDLPPLGGVPVPSASSSPRRRGRKLEVFVIFVVAVLVAHALAWPWPFVAPHVMLVVAAIVVFLLLRARLHHHRHHHGGRRAGTVDV